MDNFKKIVKFVFNKKITILIIVFIFLLAVLLPSFVYYITIDDGTFKENDWKSTPYVASTYTGQAKITDDGITTQTSVKELWDEMIKKGNNVEQYLDKPEELEKLMNAEIITQYPKIGNEEVALDGVIEFERHKTDGTSTKLKYVNKKTFNNYIETKDVTNVMNSFTLDENGDILVGIIDKTTYELKSNDSDIDISNYTDNMNNSNKVSEGRFEKVEYNISSKTINYKNTIEKYSMPFQYLWALLVISDDKDFVLELADLVNDSEIIISIYDNISTTVNKSEYNYNKEIRMGTYAEVVPEQNYEVSGYPSKRYWVGEDSENYNPSYPADYITDEKIYNVECISTYENNTPIVSVSKANVWIGEYSKEYTYKKAEELKQENNNKQLEDTEYKEVENSSKNSYQDESLLNNQHALSLKEECRAFIQDKLNKMKTEENKKTLMINGAEINIDDIKVSVNVSYVQCNSYSHEINRTQSDTTLTSSQQYVEGNTVNNIKIEKNSEQPNFVTILSSKEHREAKRNILENSSWLFELLETNPDTVSMVDLTKYLLYKLTGNSYGVTDYDFTVYESNSFSNVSTGIYNGTVQEKVWFSLKDLGYSDIAIAGAMGNIDYESAGFSTVAVEGGSGEGIGLCQWSFGRRKQLENYANSKSVSWQDEDTQVEFLVAEISGQGPASSYASKRVKGYILEEKITSTSSDWANATSVDEATLHFMRFFESPKSRGSLSVRQQRAENYYNEFQGKSAPVNIDTELTGENKEKMQKMIAEAIRIANDDTYKYSQSFRESQYYYDCSSFVSRLYKEYFGISRLDSGTAGRGTDNIRANCKSKYTVVTISSLQPGDILWKDGHVALYIGNNQIAEAQGTNAGIVVGTLRHGRFTEAYRIIK